VYLFFFFFWVKKYSLLHLFSLLFSFPFCFFFWLQLSVKGIFFLLLGGGGGVFRFFFFFLG